MDTAPGHIPFTPAVKAIQARRGSRDAYAKREARAGFHSRVTPDLAAFLEEIDTAFLATASAAGQPYAQHRGGPKGFIKVVDEKTLAFADYRGNRQYVTVGNLSENDRAFLFLMDYAHRRRVKVWGRARVVEDAALIARLMPEGYDARPEQAIVFAVEAWEGNCAQHIPQKLNAEDVAEEILRLRAEVVSLAAENAALKR